VWRIPAGRTCEAVTYGVGVLLLVAATDRELCGHDGLVCGVGPVEAAVATARALALTPVDAVVHVGIAGARGLAPGALVVGTAAVYCDLSAEWPVVGRVTPDEALVAAVRAALPDADALPIHTSAAVGGAALSLPTGPLVEAMEGFGVLRAAERAGVPAVEVRAVSNVIGEDDRRRWDVAGALTALETALPTVVRASSGAVRRGAPGR
jgi:futalosine hydrolase